MTKPCSRIQDTLAERGPTAFQNKPADQTHLAQCEACFAFMEALGRLDQELASFPNEEPSDNLIRQTLMMVEKSQKSAGATGTGEQTNTRETTENTADGREPHPAAWRGLTSLLTRFKPGLFLSPTSRNRLLILGGAAFSVILLIVVIRPQHFPNGQIIDRVVVPNEPLVTVEETESQEQLRKNDVPSTTDPMNEELDKEAAFLKKQLPADGFDKKIGLSRFFKKGSGKSNNSVPAKDGDQTGNDGDQGGLKSQKVPLPDLDVAHSQSKESNQDPKRKAKKPAAPGSNLGGRYRQDDTRRSLPTVSEKGDKTAREQKVKSEASSRRETDELSDSAFQDVVSSLNSQTSQVAPPPVETLAESRDHLAGIQAKKEKDDDVAEPDVAPDLEIGIPEASPTDETDGIARVGQVAVTPPVFVKKVIPAYPKKAEKTKLQGYVILEAVFGADGVVSEIRVLRGLGKGKFGFEEAAISALKKYSYVPGKVRGQAAAVRMTLKIDFVWGQKASAVQPSEKTPHDPTASDRRLAESFLERYQSTDDLQFQDATGYWANTYIPGDPSLKLLSKRLSAFDRSAMVKQIGGPLNLEGEAASYAQPFDPPKNAALGLHLHTNLARISEPSRVILQVGLQGADRSGGIRSAMNLGLVLDLTGPLSKPTLTKLGVLLDEFLTARQGSDQFSLTVAGRSGGFLLPPDQFRHGPLLLAKRRLLTENGHPEAEALSLLDAIKSAGTHVARGLDETAPLGSSALIIITARSLASLDQLLGPVHDLAVAGIPTSAIGVGPDTDLAQLDQLVLAGQGTRRVMSETGDGKRIVGRELNAVSRVIARAVRLRLRLAPGVRLIEVLGSQKLDAHRSQKVRQAEKSIDLHLGRNLGIQADRGEDDEGIQIVIPQFHGGDAHVILLDLWVPGPGKIADGQIRYKDLVYLRNGITRAHHSLSRHGLPEGPLQRQVTKNLIGYEISRNLNKAAQCLAAGQVQVATEQVTAMQNLLSGLDYLLPAVMRNQDLQKDKGMLAQYAAALEPTAMEHKPWRHHLSESLVYASYVKLLPGIEE